MYKNLSLEGINKIVAFINGIGQTLPEEVSAEIATSVDDKTTFSVFNLISSDKRHKFIAEKLEKYVVTYDKN